MVNPAPAPSLLLRRPGGFTLVELAVALAIAALLMLMAAPLASDWVHGAHTRQARAVLEQGHAQARALALRNPCGTPVAARLALRSSGAQTVEVSVQTGDGSGSCAFLEDHADPQWSAQLPAGVALSWNDRPLVAGEAQQLDLDSRGQPASPARFVLSQGDRRNDEHGTFP
ncbi:prepilin-type N-terminal cleavage/methylation domain-containing protein [Melaminivora sp.]|uniref:prepilin-type N-terminal cleavage/methylation domain-containing protein n=1 Tax=Melaminivora sp. TaxID=1933032 RepID=UPI0028A927F2|nr:prepilin-type N-terminal cleavage/methylation domain-containing protein [Melaminivora sp.]